jgi:hypothetical protein
MPAGFRLGFAVGIAQAFPHGLERLAEPTRPPVGDHGQTTRAHHDHPQAPQGQAHDHRLAQVGKVLGNFGPPLIQFGRARHDGFSGNQAISLSAILPQPHVSLTLYGKTYTCKLITRPRYQSQRGCDDEGQFRPTTEIP